MFWRVTGSFLSGGHVDAGSASVNRNNLFFSLRKIMAPLTKLREAAVSVSEGNYDIQVPAEGDTELAQVGKSFNQPRRNGS